MIPSVPSLKNISLVRTALAVWQYDNDLFTSSETYISSPFPEMCEIKIFWETVGNMVSPKIDQLHLPKLLKDKLLNFVENMSYQALMWFDFHKHRCKCISRIPSELCWTARGSVDYRKTAQRLVRDESIELGKRYVLACLYCLKDDIFDLWKKINSKKTGKAELESLCSSSNSLLIPFWTNHVEECLTQCEAAGSNSTNLLEFSYNEVFKHCASTGNVAATRYFYEELTKREKRSLSEITIHAAKCHEKFSIDLSFPMQCFTSVLCFLLSKMNNDQQFEVLLTSHLTLLEYFLEWPWQCHFMQVAKVVLYFLSEKDQLSVLRMVMYKVFQGYRDHDYHQLFMAVWQAIPLHSRMQSIDSLSIMSVLMLAFELGDREKVDFVLEDADENQKENLILCSVGISVCMDLILAGNWDMLKYFIQKCISTRRIGRLLKLGLEDRRLGYCKKENLHKQKKIWDDFCHLVEELEPGPDDDVAAVAMFRYTDSDEDMEVADD